MLVKQENMRASTDLPVARKRAANWLQIGVAARCREPVEQGDYSGGRLVVRVGLMCGVEHPLGLGSEAVHQGPPGGLVACFGIAGEGPGATRGPLLVG